MVRSEETVLSGTVIYGDDFDIVQGYVCLKDGIITEVGEGRVDCDLEGIICPRFINAHTHLGDSVAKDPPFMDLRSLVGREASSTASWQGPPEVAWLRG